MRTKDIVLLLSFIVLFSILFPILIILIRSNVTWIFIDDYTILYTTQFFAYLITFLIFPKVVRYTYSEFNLAVVKQMKTYVYIGTAFIILFIINLFMNSDVLKTEYIDWKPTLWIMLFMVVLVPFFEEVIFRGVLYKFFFIKKGELFAVGVTTILFAILHSDNFLFFLCMGIILSTIRYKTNSVISSFLLHVVWNGYAMFAVYN